MLLLLQFFYDNKGYRLADWAAFGDFDAVAFFDVDAWWAVTWDVTASAFVTHVFGAELQVFAFYYDCFVHFCCGDAAFENAPSDWERSVEGAVFVIAGFLWGFEC
jgi:hypothetical protein